MFCSRSLRIIRTETGKVLTFPITSPTNSNITMPKTLLLLRKRFIFASTFVFLRSLSGHDRHHCFLFRFWKALILFRTVWPAVYCPSSWIQASSNRCWFALLDRDTEGHVIVLIVDQVFLSYNMEHRNHLWGLLRCPLSVFSRRWFYDCRSGTTPDLWSCEFFLCVLRIVLSNIGEFSKKTRLCIGCITLNLAVVRSSSYIK